LPVINRKWIGLYFAPALIFLSVISFAVNEWRSLAVSEIERINYATSLQLQGKIILDYFLTKK